MHIVYTQFKILLNRILELRAKKKKQITFAQIIRASLNFRFHVRDNTRSRSNVIQLENAVRRLDLNKILIKWRDIC